MEKRNLSPTYRNHKHDKFGNQLHQLNKNHCGDPFQFSVAFHIETSHLIWTANQITGFYMKCNTVNSEACLGPCQR